MNLIIGKPRKYWQLMYHDSLLSLNNANLDLPYFFKQYFEHLYILTMKS